MGNRALLRVVTSAVRSVSSGRSIRFGQVIIAAADVDRDLFAQLAPNYLNVADRTTVYLSPYDYAVAASSHIHDYPRVGCGTAPQVLVPGIDSVVSTIPDDFPSHAYFAEALPILEDVKNLILRNEPARSGGSWEKLDGYWRIGGVPVLRKVVCRTTSTMALGTR
jgi:esterase/lipase superfamily enzyme